MRGYVEQLLAENEVRVVSREVDPQFELAGVVKQSQRESDAAVLFKNVKGSNIPVISNVYGSHRRMCDLIGAEKGKFCQRWVELIDAGASNVKEHEVDVGTPDDLVHGKISDLPHIRYFERDCAPYITAGIFLGKEPDTGVPNLSFCRTMMVSDDELRVRLAPPHDLTKYQLKAESRDEVLEVAILLGPPPEVFLSACASVPYDTNELAIAAGLNGGPIPMRPCKTIDLMVPAETQVVIEGRILPNVRKPEGPFGEFQGYYVEEGMNRVFEVTNVSWRGGAYFHSLVCGSPEDLRALEFSFAIRTYRSLASELPGILDVTCSPTPQHTVVQIDSQYDGHGQHVLLKAFGSNMNYNKIVIVVDDDVDIHDFDDVWWAVVTRCRVDKRIQIIADVPGFFRDEADVHSGRLGIDATKPHAHRDFLTRKQIPGVEALNLKDYFD